MSERFRVLEGLPPYGPMPEQFSATGLGTHREGFVVEFQPDGAPRWVGNFQRGLSRFDRVLEPGWTEQVIVIAGGHAYVVDPRARSCVRTFGGDIDGTWSPRPDLLLFSDGIEIEAIGPDGPRWRTRRISWDGFRELGLDLEADVLCGEAYDPMEDDWKPFTVDLSTGEVRGGSFPPES